MKLARALIKNALLWAALFGLFAWQDGWKILLETLMGRNPPPLFNRATLLQLALEHISLAGLAMLGVLIVGLPLAVWVTRSTGKPFLSLVSSLTALGQTFPPVAVLFLALPIFGFGSTSVYLALFLYGLLPTVSSTLVGLSSVNENARDAARGMGMNEGQMLVRLELPLALPAVLAGLRTSFVLLIATAALAPLVGAGGLGQPIIAGLSVNNLGYVLEGAVAVALLALLADYTLRDLERTITPWA
ncbi:MAG: ABC transporter permease [Pseudopedobacter sp.]|nr:ABC transporter permease [Deinococcales bacterium]